MKRIIWISRHEPLPAQLRELERIFGAGVKVDQDPRPFSSAEDIASRARGYDEVLVVAPLSVIARLIELGIKPLWAEMERIDAPTGDPDAEVEASGRWYRFRRFRRITRITIEYEDM